MRPIFRIFIFLLMSVVPAVPSWGGALIINSRSTLSISADRIRVDVFAENKGNESAYGVQAHLYIFDRHLSADAVVDLGVNQNRIFHFEVPLPTALKGEFPFVGEVLYHDVSGLPVTAFSAGTFNLGSAGGGRLSGRAPDLTLTANESVSVTVSSGDPKPRDVIATLYLPRALTTPQKQKQITLAPFGTITVDFPLTSRPGAGGEIYTVFCTLTYHDAGAAHAAVVRTAVHVKAFQNWFVKTRWYWLGAGVLIVLGWGWVGVRKEG